MGTWCQEGMFRELLVLSPSKTECSAVLKSRVIIPGKEDTVKVLPCSVSVSDLSPFKKGIVAVGAEWPSDGGDLQGGSIHMNFGLMNIPYISPEGKVPYVGMFIRVKSKEDSPWNPNETLSAHLTSLAIIDYFADLLVASGKNSRLIHSERVNQRALNLYRILEALGEYTEIEEDQSGWEQTPLHHRFFIATYPKRFELNALLSPSVREGLEAAAKCFLARSGESDS